MREIFGIEASAETRLWNKYTSNTYEQLAKPDASVQVSQILWHITSLSFEHLLTWKL